MDTHAQWDIQAISGEMTALVKKAAPVASALACGKDQFNKIKKQFYK